LLLVIGFMQQEIYMLLEYSQAREKSSSPTTP